MIVIMLDKLFHALQAEVGRVRSLDQGQTLFHRETPVRSVHLLCHGAVDLVRPQSDGAVLLLHHLSGTGIIAEASLYAAKYHCDCICVESAEIFSVSRKRVEDLLRRSPELYENWSAYLAVELQNARHRSELLSRKTVAERLSGWIDWNGKLPPRGRWKYVAQEIGVTPEALYREIKKRGDEGG
jgi:CRP/FNR family transcriptional regulator, dissimilatory nitrate respiration regulator